VSIHLELLLGTCAAGPSNTNFHTNHRATHQFRCRKEIAPQMKSINGPGGLIVLEDQRCEYHLTSVQRVAKKKFLLLSHQAEMQRLHTRITSTLRNIKKRNPDRSQRDSNPQHDKNFSTHLLSQFRGQRYSPTPIPGSRVQWEQVKTLVLFISIEGFFLHQP